MSGQARRIRADKPGVTSPPRTPPRPDPVHPTHPAHPAAWEHSTLRLNKAEVSLFTTPGDTGQRSACLVVYSGAHAGKRFALDRARTVIGRLPDNEAHLDSPGISRRHAELQTQGDTVVLHDLGSANGTLLNGARLEMPTALKDGDLLRLGEVTLKFYDRQNMDAVLHDRLYRIATVDAGTELYTRRYVLELLERELHRSRRSGQPLSVVALDLDHFKSVNDRWGHAAGDTVLHLAANTVAATARAGDTVGRLGGEEFLVVMPDTALTAALAAAERMRAALAARVMPIDLPGASAPVQHRQTASLGVVQFDPAMRSVSDLLGAADERLYAAKHNGRNCVGRPTEPSTLA